MAKARDIRIIADDDLNVLQKMTSAIKDLNAVIVAVSPSMATASHAFHQQLRDDMKASTAALYRFSRVVERIGSSALFSSAGATAGASFTAGLNAALGAVALPAMRGGGMSASAYQNAIREMVAKVNSGLGATERADELRTGKRLGDTFAEGIRQGLSQQQLGNLLRNAIDNLDAQGNANEQGARLASAFAKGVGMGLRKGELKAFVALEFQRISRESDLFQLSGAKNRGEQGLQLMREFGRGILDGVPIVREAWRSVSEFMRDVRALDGAHEAGLAGMRAFGRGVALGGSLLVNSLLSALRIGFRGVQTAGGLVLDFGEWVARQIGNGIRGAAHLVGEAVRWVTDRFRGDGQIDQSGAETGRRFANGIIQGLFGQSNELRRAGVQLIQDGFSTLAGSGIGLLVQGQGARTAIEFEEQLKLVEVFGDLTVAEVERVKQRIFSVAMETIFDPDEQAEAFLTLLKSGLTVSDAEEVLKPLSDFAVASQDTLDGASEKMIQVLSSFEIPLNEIESAMDTLVGGADISITNVQDLTHAMTFVGPVAAAMGVELDEVTAALALLSDRGLDAARGGTGLRAILSSLIKPTEQAKGVLSQLGITTKDAQGNFVGMSELLAQFQVAINELEQPRTYQAMTETSRIVMETYQEIEELADGSFQIVEKTRPIIEEEMIPMFDELGNAVERTARGLGEVEIVEMLAPLGDRVAITALLNLIKTTEGGTLVFDEYAQKLGEARSATEIAEAISGTFKFRLDELGSAVQVLNIQAFTPFLNDVISPFVVGLTNMVSAVAQVNPEILKMGLTLFAGASALAGLFAVLQIGVGTIAVLGAGMATFGAIISSPILLIGSALTAVGLLFVDFEQAWNGLTNGLTNGLDAGADALMRVGERIESVFGRLLGVRDTLQEVVGAIGMFTSGAFIGRDVFETGSNQDVILGLMAERDALLRQTASDKGDYLIQPGDTLSAIASELGMSVDELMRLNQLDDPNRIVAGTMLRTRGGMIGDDALARVREIEAIVRDLPFFGSQKVGTEIITGLTRLERVAQRLGIPFRDLVLLAEYVKGIWKEVIPLLQGRDFYGFNDLSVVGDVLPKFNATVSDLNERIREVVGGIDFGLPFADAIIGGIRGIGSTSSEELTGAVRYALEWIGAAFRLVMFTISPITSLGGLLVRAMFGGMGADIGRIIDEVNASGVFEKIKTSLYTILEEDTGRVGVSVLEGYLRVLDAIVGGNYGQAVGRLGDALRVTFVQLGDLFDPSMPNGLDPADRKFYEGVANPLIGSVRGMIEDVTLWIQTEAPTALAVLSGTLLAEFTRAVGSVFNYASANEFFVPQMIEFVDTALDALAVGVQGDPADRKFGASQESNGFTMLFKGLLENTSAWLAGDGAVLLGELVGTAFAILGDVLTATGQVLFEETDWQTFGYQFMDSFGQGFADGALSWWDQNEIIVPVGMGFHLRMSGAGTELIRLGDLARDVTENSMSLLNAGLQQGIGLDDMPLNITADMAVKFNEISFLYETAGEQLTPGLADLARLLGATNEFDYVDGRLQIAQDVYIPLEAVIEGMDEAALSQFEGDLSKLGVNIANGIQGGIMGSSFLESALHITSEIENGLGIRSPSTEGVIIGGYLADGIQLGFANKFIDWDVNDIIFGAYALGAEGVAEGVAAEEGVLTPFSAILVDVNRYVYEGVPSILLAHETLRSDLALLEGAFSTLGAVSSAMLDGIQGRLSVLGGRVVITTSQVSALGGEFAKSGILATTGTNAMIIAMDTLYMKLKLIAPLAEAITKMFSVAGQPIGGVGGGVTGRYAGGMVNAGTLAEVAETRRGVGFEILESGGRSYLYGNADVNVVSPYSASAMEQYRSVGTESITYGGDTSVNIVVNADGGVSGGDYNGLARDVADLVMSRVNRQTYGRRGLSTL